MPISLRNFSELVSEINAAAAGFPDWEPVLTKIVAAAKCDSAGLLIAASTASRLDPVYVGIAADMIARYNDHYHRVDPIAHAIRQNGESGIWDDDELVPWAINRRTETYNDWAIPGGIRDGVFASISDHAIGTTALCITRERRGDMSNAKRLLVLLEPHLRRAIHIQAHLGERGGLYSGSLDALDLISHGIVLLDENGKVTFRNAAAIQILRSSGTLGVDRNQHLRAVLSANDRALQKMLGQALRGVDGVRPAGSAAISRPAPRRALLLHVLPLNRSDIGPPAAMVVVVDPEKQPEPSTRFLQRTFNLTEAEAEVAKSVMDGLGLQHAADKLSVSLPTVRTHLQHAFDKTGVHRQAALVRLLLAVHGALAISE